MHDFFHSVASFGLACLTFFSPHTHYLETNHNISTPTPIIHETHRDQDHDIITANGLFSKYNQTITITFHFDENGGKIDGTIGGACIGKIQGNYSGSKKGTLTGTAYAACPIFITAINGTATFHADVDLNTNAVTLQAKVFAQGMSQDISVPLILTK